MRFDFEIFNALSEGNSSDAQTHDRRQGCLRCCACCLGGLAVRVRRSLVRSARTDMTFMHSSADKRTTVELMPNGAAESLMHKNRLHEREALAEAHLLHECGTVPECARTICDTLLPPQLRCGADGV